MILPVLTRIMHTPSPLSLHKPARSVRVQVSLPPEVALLLRGEAARQGRSASSLAGYLLENAIRSDQ